MFNRLVYKTIRFFWKTSTVAGWISFQDAIITQILLSEQEKFGCNGDFLEIGTYEGKYALLCSPYFKGEGQTIYLNDVFDGFMGLSTENVHEIETQYQGMSLEILARNLEKFNVANSRILQKPSRRLRYVDFSRNIRLIHIDGSHLYEEVKRDLDLALNLVDEKYGVIVVDDYRSLHTPGVAKAIWERDFRRELQILVMSPAKMYLAKQGSDWKSDEIVPCLVQSGIPTSETFDFGQSFIYTPLRRNLIYKCPSFFRFFQQLLNVVKET